MWTILSVSTIYDASCFQSTDSTAAVTAVVLYMTVVEMTCKVALTTLREQDTLNKFKTRGEQPEVVPGEV